MAEHVAYMREIVRLLVCNPERKRLYGASKGRDGDNIKRNVKGIGWDGVDWINLVQNKKKW